MQKLNIVIISARSFPTLSPRAHRATELAIELVKLGHDVSLYALLGEYDYSEVSKETGVKFKNLGSSKFGNIDNTGSRNKNIFYKIFSKLLGKYFEFPNIELYFLVKKVLKYNKIDYLISIAHPHTIHWGVASYIKHSKNNNIKFWVADCGDPYMKDPFNYHPFYFKYFEKSWCKNTNHIIVPIEEAKEGYYREFLPKIEVIPQGLDFSKIKISNYKKNEVVTFAYSGIFYENKRDPSKLLEYLSYLDIDFKFIIYTKTVQILKKFKAILGDKLEIRDYIPREKLIFELSKMDFLINIKNNSEVQQPSKLLDYFISKRPVFQIDSSFNNINEFDLFMKNNYSNKMKEIDINRYDIKTIANDFLNLYNK